jgi:hypothetical protein
MIGTIHRRRRHHSKCDFLTACLCNREGKRVGSYDNLYTSVHASAVCEILSIK